MLLLYQYFKSNEGITGDKYHFGCGTKRNPYVVLYHFNSLDAIDNDEDDLCRECTWTALQGTCHNGYDVFTLRKMQT